MKNLYLLILLLSLKSLAQTPTLDNTFNSKDNGTYEQNIGTESIILPDDKLLSIYGPGPYRKVIRLNKDGSIDTTFKYNDNIMYVDKIYANSSGNFLTVLTNYNDISGLSTIKCYNGDGTVNSNFSIPVFSALTDANPTGTDNVGISDVQYQDDGKIILIGNFTKANGKAINCIVRLNSDGSVDETFSSNIFPNSYGNYLSSLVMQKDGKYLVGGEFKIYDPVRETYQFRLIRLNSDGSWDKSFYIPNVPGFVGTITGIDFRIEKISLQTDNKIIVAGANYILNSKTKSIGFIRFNTDGSFDPTFSASATNDEKGIDNFCIQKDNKIVFVGYDRVYRLNNDGTFDKTFLDTNTLQRDGFATVYVQDNKIIYNNDYNTPAGLTRKGITRLNSDGSLDLTFNPQSGTNILSTSDDLYPESSELSNTAVLMDGKILTFGCFTSYNDIAFNHICKLTQDGQFDQSFVLDPKISFAFTTQGTNISKIRQQKDGKILLSSTNLIKIRVNKINTDLIRINANGTLDNTFNFDSSNNIITDFKIQSNGQIIVIGTGPLFTESSKYKMIRINSDGSLDTSFQSKLFTENLTSIEIQNDDKILVNHPNIWDYTANRSVTLERFDKNGSLEANFVPTKTSIYYSKLQPDGKIIISYYNIGESATYLARLNNDGSIDNSFTQNYVSGTESTRIFSMIFLTSQGKIIITPILNRLNNNTINKKFIVLSKDGIMENSFGDPNIISKSVVQQNCDALIVSGYFNEIEGSKKNNLVRYNLLNNSTVAMPNGNFFQTFTEGQTLADLKIDGQNILWYNTQNLCSFTNYSTNKIKNTNVVLPSNTLLVEGNTYFASQVINGIESNYRLSITVSKTLGTIDPIFESLKTYPNPIDNYWTISNKSIIDRIEVYDLLGQTLLSEKYDSKTIKIDLSNFATGIYVAKIHSDDHVKSMKIIKK